MVSLVLFLGLEYKQLLTRLTGLRPFSADPYGIKSALFFSLAGVPGLMFRSSATDDLATDTESRPAAAEPQQTDGVREIIETIVFVVVLVLLLKSFAAEAFVIPTGSMAETLYGYQRIVKCPQCGLEFPVNCSSEVEPQQGNGTEPPKPVLITGCTCPACRYNIDFQAEELKNPGWKKPDWNSGDRVLVAKFLYELFNKRPNRLDVVVFKYPGDSKSFGDGHGGSLFPRTGPIKNQTPMNYIKRLIGLPGETIAIHRGNLYVLPPGSGIEYNDWKEAQTNEEMRIKLWQWQYMHVNDPDALRKFEQEQFKIIRKPPETILTMRRIVYDNDHQAQDLKKEGFPARWAGEKQSKWSEKDTSFQIEGADAEKVEWLHYRNYLRTFRDKTDALTHERPARSLITDFQGYNSYEPHPNGHTGENWVGDLLVECDVKVLKPEGEVVLELSRSHDRFQLRWHLSNGDMDLIRIHTDDQGKKTEENLSEHRKATTLTKPSANSTYRLRFANFDDRLTVWVDGSLPFDDGVKYQGSKEQHAGPVAENDLEPASIGVKGAAVTVSNLSLWRDTYYTASTSSPVSPDAGGTVDFADPTKWDSMQTGMPVQTLYVQPDHFLCLGDNSPESSDGRSWGLVPERLLLGRAMLVYYPFKFPYWPFSSPVNRVERIR